MRDAIDRRNSLKMASTFDFSPHGFNLVLKQPKHYLIMRKSFIAAAAALALMMTANVSTAQIQTPAPSPSATLTQRVGLTDIELNYSRPGKKDRKVMGELVPFGEIWRTGANSATTIAFSSDVTFGDKAVKAGTYALYTLPGESEWTVMLYSDLSMGGNVANYDNSKEVVRVTGKVEKIDMTVETFTMDINNIRDNGAHLVLMWENTVVRVPMEVSFDEMVMAQIERTMKNPMSQAANNYAAAASYYYQNGKDLNKALEWINAALSINSGAFWWMHTKAQIQLGLGDNKGAIATAEASKKAASENASGDFGYVARNEDLIKKAKGK